jgi:2-keto-3-deoxy-L-fuconate dehydrogenase
MNGGRLQGKRAVITQAKDFMGPALCEVFAEQGATVLADDDALTDPGRPAALIAAAGQVDILVVNLAVPAPSTRAHEVEDAEWRHVFEHMVDPLPRLFGAVLPQMIERRAGKIVLMGSAAALRGMKRTSTYSAARGAQLAYVQAVGVEVAPYNVQVNAIAQNFVDNPTYFPPEVQANPAFQKRLAREVPAGRLGGAHEDARLAAFLASDEVNFLSGQAIPFCGGWATR